MSAIPSKSVNPTGLHQRYVVTKVDDKFVDPMATYFVLRLDHFGRDGIHVAACRAAARAYADEIDKLIERGESDHLRKVAQELRTLVDNLEKAG